MQGISVEPSVEKPSKLSIYHYKYLFEQLMVSEECDEDFWMPIVGDMLYGLGSWSNFKKISFQITSSYEIQGDFTKAFKLQAHSFIQTKEMKELLPKLMIKYANMFERRITLPRLVEFLYQERVYFIRCFSTLFLNVVKEASEMERFLEDEENEENEETEGEEEENEENDGDVSMKRRKRKRKLRGLGPRKGLVWEGIVDKIMNKNVNFSYNVRECICYSRMSINDYKGIQGTAGSLREREEQQITEYYKFVKRNFEEISEELDLMFMMIFSRKESISLVSFYEWLRLLCEGQPIIKEPNTNIQLMDLFNFGAPYFKKRSEIHIRTESLRIPALCVINFMQLVQTLEETPDLFGPDNLDPKKNKQIYETYKKFLVIFDKLVVQSSSDTCFYGLVSLCWATFLRRNWNNNLERMLGEGVIIRHFENGIRLQGIKYLGYLFNRQDENNYPFYGREQNIQAYKTIVSDFLAQFLGTMDDLPTVNIRFLEDIVKVTTILLSPYNPSVQLFENKFLKDFYWNFIDLKDDEHLKVHPFTQIFHIAKSYLPSKLEFLDYFSTFCFGPGSTFTISSFLNNYDHFTLDFSKEEFLRDIKKEKVSIPSAEVQRIVPQLLDTEIFDDENNKKKNKKNTRIIQRFPEYILLEAYEDKFWTEVRIPKGTRFIILSEEDNLVLVSFYNIKNKVIDDDESSSGNNNNNNNNKVVYRQEKLSGLRILLRIFWNIKYRLQEKKTISPRNISLFEFFQKIFHHGSHPLLRFIDFQLFKLRNVQVKKDELPRIGSGLFFLQLLSEILNLALDQINKQGGATGSSYLIQVVSGVWKCLNSFANKKPREVMALVMKYLYSFDQVVEIEGYVGKYSCVLEKLGILKTLTEKHSLRHRQDVFYLIEWMAGNIFVGHISWKYHGFTHRWMISLKCLEIFNKLVEYYSVDELEVLMETLFFDPHNRCGQVLFNLLGQCREWYKGILQKQKGDDVFLVIGILEQGFKFVNSLLKFKNEHNFIGNAIHTSLEHLIGKEQKPLIRILFQYTLVNFPSEIRKRACLAVKQILELKPSISVIASLGSKAMMFIGKQLHYLQNEMEDPGYKISLIQLITSAIQNQKGLGQIYMNFDPSSFHYSEVEKSSKGSSYHDDGPQLNTYIKKKELTEGGYISILLNCILKKFQEHSEENDSMELIQVTLESIQAILTSSSSEIRDVVRSNPQFWKILFDVLQNLSIGNNNNNNNKQQNNNNNNNNRTNNTTIFKLQRERKKSQSIEDEFVVKSLKSILDIITIDLYYGKLMNTYIVDPSMFKSFYLEYKSNPGIFLDLLGRTIENIKREINECCVNLVVLKGKVRAYNIKYFRKSLNLENFKSRYSNKVYDIERLKRWKLRVLLRKELEIKNEYLNSDRSKEPIEKEIDLFVDTTHPDYEMIVDDELEIFELAKSMNQKYNLMNSYIEMLSSFGSMFTVFVIPLKDMNDNPVLISFPRISSFLDHLVYNGLEFYSKKSELPDEIKNMQVSYHLKCSNIVLLVFKAIAQMVGIQVLNHFEKQAEYEHAIYKLSGKYKDLLSSLRTKKKEDVKKEEKERLNKYGKDIQTLKLEEQKIEFKTPKYVRLKHFEILCYVLDREVKLRNDELVLQLLLSILFLLSKIPLNNTEMHITQQSMILKPVLLKILNTYKLYSMDSENSKMDLFSLLFEENTKNKKKMFDEEEFNENEEEEEEEEDEEMIFEEEESINHKYKLSFEEIKKSQKINKFRVHPNHHNNEKIEKIIFRTSKLLNNNNNNNMDDEEENEEDDEEKLLNFNSNSNNNLEYRKERIIYQIINLTLHLISYVDMGILECTKTDGANSKFSDFNDIRNNLENDTHSYETLEKKEQFIPRILDLVSTEYRLSKTNLMYRPNCEYLENLLVTVQCIMNQTHEAYSKSRKIFLSRRETNYYLTMTDVQFQKNLKNLSKRERKKKIEYRKKQLEEQERKKKQLLPKEVFPGFIIPTSKMNFGGFLVKKSLVLESSFFLIFKVFPFWNNLVFKTERFLEHYISVVKKQSPSEYLKNHPISESEIFRVCEYPNILEKKYKLNEHRNHNISLLSHYYLNNNNQNNFNNFNNNFDFNFENNFSLLFRMFQGTIHCHKINWSRGYEKKYCQSYPSWHTLYIMCLRLMISLIVQYKEKEMKEKILLILRTFCDNFLSSCFLKVKKRNNNFRIRNKIISNNKNKNSNENSNNNNPNNNNNNNSSFGIKKNKYQRQQLLNHQKKKQNKNRIKLNRKKKKIQDIVDENLIFTLSELKECKFITCLFYLLANELKRRENEKFVFSMIEGFGQSIEMLSQGVESIVKPFTNDERKLYQDSFDLRTYFFGEDDYNDPLNLRLFSSSSKNKNKKNKNKKIFDLSDSDDDSDDENKRKEEKEREKENRGVTILERSLKLISKGPRFSWSTRLHLILLEIIGNQLIFFSKLLYFEMDHASKGNYIEVLRKHDVSSKNFYDIIELLRVVIKLIPKILRIGRRKKEDEFSGIPIDIDLDDNKNNKKNKKKENPKEKTKLQKVKKRKILEGESFSLFGEIYNIIILCVEVSTMHLNQEFKEGIKSNIIHHRNSKELKGKMLGNLRDVLTNLRNTLRSQECRKAFTNFEIRNRYFKQLEYLENLLVITLTHKFPALRKVQNEFVERYAMGSKSKVGGGLFE